MIFTFKNRSLLFVFRFNFKNSVCSVSPHILYWSHTLVYFISILAFGIFCAFMVLLSASYFLVCPVSWNICFCFAWLNLDICTSSVSALKFNILIKLTQGICSCNRSVSLKVELLISTIFKTDFPY